MSVQPKLWSERDFDECCYAISGVGPGTMVCAAPCRGSYCVNHRKEMDEAYYERKKIDYVNRARSVARAEARAKAKHPPVQQISMASLVSAIAEKHGLAVGDITGPSLKRSLIPARHEFFYRAHEAGKSFPQIGRFCGGRDHTSVLSGYRRHLAREAMRMAAE